MRRDIDNVEFKEINRPSEEVSKPSILKKPIKPIKIGVHVKYNGKEYVVQSLMDDDKIFIVMEDEEYIVNKSEVEVIR